AFVAAPYGRHSQRGWGASIANSAGWVLMELPAVLGFLAVFLLTSIPGVRRMVTPRSVRRARVRRAALQQFLAHGLHVTRDRTGVMIFAALSDHQVEVVADEGIHARVDRDVWAEAVATLARGMKDGDAASGFERAIGLCGGVLAEHFRPAPEIPTRSTIVWS
ncbi:MAG: TPM domain-containing protein, partial [Alphaproteobacteria bacterium]|nr:TPM domain-containing protein [Alphaproteobacteria bacterium]